MSEDWGLKLRRKEGEDNIEMRKGINMIIRKNEMGNEKSKKLKRGRIEKWRKS